MMGDKDIKRVARDLKKLPPVKAAVIAFDTEAWFDGFKAGWRKALEVISTSTISGLSEDDEAIMAELTEKTFSIMGERWAMLKREVIKNGDIDKSGDRAGTGDSGEAGKASDPDAGHTGEELHQGDSP